MVHFYIMRFTSKLKTLLDRMGDSQQCKLARRLDTSVAYLHKLARGHGTPTLMFGARIVKEVGGGLTLDDLVAARLLRISIGPVGRGYRA